MVRYHKKASVSVGMKQIKTDGISFDIVFPLPQRYNLNFDFHIYILLLVFQKQGLIIF